MTTELILQDYVGFRLNGRTGYDIATELRGLRMKPDEKYVTTLEEAIHVLMDLRDKKFFSFRGQRNQEWPLGIHHPPDITEPDLQEGLAQFRKRCMEFPSPDYLGEREHWRWLFFAQHYRLRTRLLDWTTNPLVALYFAVENILTDHTIVKMNPCGAVWALRVHRKDFRSERELPKNPRKQERWIMINPPLVTSRLLRQSGKFSYHPNGNDDPLDSDKIEKRHRRETLVKVIIGNPSNPDPELADDIRERLGIMNVHHASLFPDPEGVALFINEQWRAITTQKPKNKRKTR